MSEVTLNVRFPDKAHIEIEGENLEHITGRMLTLFQRALIREIKGRRAQLLLSNRRAAKAAEQEKERVDTDEILADAIVPAERIPEMNAEVLNTKEATDMSFLDDI